MSKRGLVIGITGGISTGKSTFSQLLQERLNAVRFDADRAAHTLVEEDAEVRALLRRQFGAEVFSASGNLNRPALRAIVFAEPDKKRALEQILHPRIRHQWATEAKHSHLTGALFLADIPLLYETQGESLCDTVVVVACSHTLQQERLMRRSSLSRAQAQAMISTQMPLFEKILRANHIAWNNGPLPSLKVQVDVLAALWS